MGTFGGGISLWGNEKLCTFHSPTCRKCAGARWTRCSFLPCCGWWYKLVPPPPTTFDLTVNVRSVNEKDPVITSGNITIDFDNNRTTQPIRSNGQADFKGVPEKFRDTTVKVLPHVEAYLTEYQEIRLDNDVIDLQLKKAVLPDVELTGRVVPVPRKSDEVTVLVEGESSSCS